MYTVQEIEMEVEAEEDREGRFESKRSTKESQ